MQSPTSTSSHHHNAELAEYGVLLSRLRDALNSGIHTDNVFLHPQPFSPLAREYEQGDRHVEREMQNIGGQVRSDRLLSLTQVLKYYGLEMAPPQNNATLAKAIRELEERCAIHRLGLEQGNDIALLLSVDDQQKINNEISLVLGDEETPIIDRLAREADSPITAEHFRTTPNDCLLRLLDSHKARYLAGRLLDVLGWYGAHPGEQTIPGLGIRLLAEALRIWYRPSPQEQPDTIAGYRLRQASNHGKSYPCLRREFENHLLDSGRVTTDLEKIVLARLLLSTFPIEFQVRDIPADILYASSVVWVNFVHGANLAHALDPCQLQRMTFQQLVDFPLKKSANASVALRNLIALTRAPAALAWAHATGALAPNQETADKSLLLLNAVTALENHTQRLNDAIIQLSAELPQRLNVAQEQLDKVFGDSLESPDKIRLMPYDGNPVARNKRSIMDTPDVAKTTWSMIEVYASKGFDAQKKWYISHNGKVRNRWMWLDDNGRIKHDYLRVKEGRQPFYGNPPPSVLPDFKTLFDTHFNDYLAKTRSAYQYLINSQLVTLPLPDRQALEHGEVRFFTLKNETENSAPDDETAQVALPRRARMGFVLQATYQTKVTYYECLPRAGVIRVRPDISGDSDDRDLYVTEHADNHSSSVCRSSLPFDWNAHQTGTPPKANASCGAILDLLGAPLPPSLIPPALHSSWPNLTLSSPRTLKIASFIAQNLFYLDENKLRDEAWGEPTELERELNKQHWIHSIKEFIPFWGALEDLQSDSLGTRILGAIGLVVDIVSFAIPLGKFAAGSIRLVVRAGKMGVRTTLPLMADVSKKLITSSLKNLNPLDGVPDLLRLTGRGLQKAGRTVMYLENKALFQLKKLAGRVDQYDFINRLPQMTEPGRWKPLTDADQLAIVKGIEDVPVRNVDASGSRYCLLDPMTSRPYGPRLTTRSGDLSLGRSSYNTLEQNNHHVVVELSENSHVREVLEVDGKTTLFIDDQPYRLKSNALCRADLIDDTYKVIPCRVRRTPSPGLCKTSYVVRDPAPTPDIGSVDDVKGWAPWFGDTLYIPATGRTAMRIDAMLTPSTLTATMEFQKGIYGRVMISVPATGQDLVDSVRTGATIVEAIDGAKHYIFTRLDAGHFYVAERAKGQNVFDTLTFKKAETLPEALKSELMVIYTGSLNANNMVRIHGQASVERALKAMDDIAISIGSHANPPDTLKLLKVDTSPGEAALFDHSTRMIVRSSTDGAATWSLSKAAPDSVRETTAEIFNNLFGRTVITVNPSTQTGPKALKIDDTMRQLQRLISTKTGRPVHSPRNIAFAEIKTKAGVHEVYVSVSGQQGDTDFLPLFAKNRTTNEVKVGNTRYFNIDRGARFPETALSVTPEGKLQAIPHTIANIETYTPALTSRPTSLDTESKLIDVIRGKYPDPKDLDSITIATTMAPCDSCSVVMKQFAYDGNPDALDVIWK